MLITKKSIISGKQNIREVDITPEQFDRILHRRQNKELIQNIVPNLSADDREFLISGITPEEWDKTF